MSHPYRKLRLKFWTKITIISAMLIAVIYLSGCSQTGAGQVYRTGTDGLTIEFPSSNAKEIYEGEEFGIAFFARNQGSYDLTTDNPGILKISYDTYRLQNYSTQPQELEIPKSEEGRFNGKSQYYPTGDEYAGAFYFKANRLTELREGASTKINFNLCYPYTAEVTTMMCIDTKKVTNDQTTSACTSEDYNGASGQGGPIVVSRIESETLLQSGYARPQFKIFIENKGKGYVSMGTRCSDDTFVNRDSASRVKVNAWISNMKLECGPDASGVLRLTDSNSFITCYLPKSNTTGYSRSDKSYITPLTINISYTYVLFTEYKIDIKRNDNLEPERAQASCNSYQIDYEGRCMDLCDYCSGNPSDPKCSGSKPTGDFEFTSDFNCACSLSDCNARQPRGNCIKGYCPGSSYCCVAVDDCGPYQIKYNGVCVDKCAYCADTNHEKDSVCGSTFDFTGFSCQEITSAQCDTYAKDKACIKSFCGGNNVNKYCANTDKAKTETATASS